MELFQSNHTQQHEIKHQAIDWLRRFNRGMLAEEKQALLFWLRQSHQHQQTLIKQARQLCTKSALQELQELLPNDNIVSPINRHADYVIASVIAMVIFIGIFQLIYFSQYHQFNLNKPSNQQATFSTLVGEQKKITLTDGSVVQLNTNSQVMINFSAEKRLIQLVKGEALFRVEKDKNRPFTVMVNEQSYTALGTVFALRKSSNAEVTLTVTEGKVLLTDTASVAQIPEHFTELDEFDLPGLVIHPNEQAIAKNGKAQQIDQLPREVVYQQLAWQHGMLIFNDQPLSSVLTEVERYTQTQFELSPELASIRVGGSYHTGDIDTFLSSLKQNFSLAIIPIGKNKVRISANKFNNHQK